VTNIAKLILVLAAALVTVQAQSTKPATQPNVHSQPVLDKSKVLDLTYDFDDATIYWPNAQAFRWEKESWGMTPAGYWYAAARYSASEHGGTHMDSPIHFAEGGLATDQVPVTRLVGPAAVVDISAACERDSDYRLTVADLESWEKRHHVLTSDDIVLIRTGWGRYWPDKKRYLGSDVPGDTAHLHFPGISREAAELLAARHVAGVGLDTASLDYGPSRDFIAHRVLLGANIYGLENVAHLERLPEAGAWLIALPLKIKGGTGGPTRIIAVLP
jgi:kynurenine formamidase